MPIRIERATTERASTLVIEDWGAQIELLEAQCEEAVAGGRPAAYAQLWREVSVWQQPHRRLQAHKLLCGPLGVLPARHPREWADYFLAAGDALLDDLKTAQHEPYRWNALGVVLFELGETKAATHCFRAVERLEPDFPQLKHNLAGVRARGKRNVASALLGARGAVRARVLAEQASREARRVQPVDPHSQRISLVMIVKDEEEMLPDCLASVVDVVDEMIVVDTGSTDRTVEIAKSFGATVDVFPWTGSFADARNRSLELATGDWVLHLDADERLVAEDGPELRALVARTWREAFALVETNYTGSAADSASVTHEAVRLWRHRPEYRFEGVIHEQKTHTMPTYVSERFEQTTLRIIHYGYLKDRITARAKSERNITLLLEEARVDPTAFNRFNLGSEYLALGDFDSATRYLDTAWDLVQEQSRSCAGFVPLLAYRRVKARRSSGDIAGAVQAATQGLALFPHHTDIVIEQALCARAEDNLDDAIAYARRALEMGDAPPRMAGVVGMGTYVAQALLGEFLYARGEHEQAIQLWREVLAEHPDYLTPVTSLVTALLAGGADPEAVAEEAEPFVAASLANGGLLVASALYEHGSVSHAKRLFERVLEAHPSLSVARLGLVECALSEGDLDRVAELCDDIAGGDPCGAPLLHAALFAEAIGHARPDRLRVWLERAEQLALPEPDQQIFSAWSDLLEGQPVRQLDSEAAHGVVALIDASLKLQRFDATEQLIGLLRGSDMDLRDQHQQLARTYLGRGFLQSATEEWLTSIDAFGVDAPSVLGLAQIAYAEGRPDEALGLAGDACELDPEYRPASLMVERLQDKLAA